MVFQSFPIFGPFEESTVTVLLQSALSLPDGCSCSAFCSSPRPHRPVLRSSTCLNNNLCSLLAVNFPMMQHNDFLSQFSFHCSLTSAKNFLEIYLNFSFLKDFQRFHSGHGHKSRWMEPSMGGERVMVIKVDRPFKERLSQQRAFATLPLFYHKHKSGSMTPRAPTATPQCLSVHQECSEFTLTSSAQ